MDKNKLLAQKAELEKKKSDLQQELTDLANDIKKTAEEKETEKKRIDQEITRAEIEKSQIEEWLAEIEKTEDIQTRQATTKVATGILEWQIKQQQPVEQQQLNLYSYEGFMKALDELENQLKAMQYNLKETSTNASGKKTLKITRKKLTRRIKVIEEMKKNKETYQKRSKEWDDKRRTNSPNQTVVSSAQEITDGDVANYLEILNEFEPFKRDISNLQAGKLSNQAESPLNSKEQVKADVKEQKEYLKEQQELDKLLSKAAVLEIFNNNKTQARKALQNIIRGEMDMGHQLQYQALFARLGQHIANYPAIYEKVSKAAKRNSQFAKNIGCHLESSLGAPWKVEHQKTYYPPVDYRNAERKDVYENGGGVLGVVRKCMDYFPNLEPKTKDSRASLITTAGVLYAGWKGIQRLFSTKGSDGKRKIWFPTWWKLWALIGLGVVIPKITTGQNALELLSWLFNGTLDFSELTAKLKNFTTFGATDQSPDTQLQERITNNMLLMTTPFGETTPRQLQASMQEWNTNPTSYSKFYTDTYAQLQNSSPTGIERLYQEQFGSEYDQKKYIDWFTTIGVGYPVSDDSLLDKPMVNIQAMIIDNRTKLGNYFIEQGNISDKKDKKTQDRINRYAARYDLSDKSVIEKMKAEGLFEVNDRANTDRQEDRDFLKARTEEIANGLTSLDETQKKNLTMAVIAFYNERKISEKPKFSLLQEGTQIYLQSHQDEISGKEQKIEIDAKNWTLPGFSKDGVQLPFTNLTALLRAAYVTNGLMKMVTNIPAENDTPFHYRNPIESVTHLQRLPIKGSGMYYATKDKIDTQFLSDGPRGWFGKMDDVAPELHTYPNEYADYLNKMWKERGGESSITPTETFETLPNTAPTKDQISQLWLSDTDAYLAQKACNEIYATYGEEAQTLGIHLRKEGEHLMFTSYGKEIKINLTTKTLEGFVTEGNRAITFNNIAELIKAANFINVIKYHSESMVALANLTQDGTSTYAVHPFYIDGYGNLMFRGTGESTTVATGIHRSIARLPGLNNALAANSPTLNAHKEDFAAYLNKQNPPFWKRYDQW